MKKSILSILFTAGILFACTQKEPVVAQYEPGTVPTTSPEEQGEQLIKRSDCLACHKVEGALIGPSYKQIADKYTDADLEMLAQKIIDGGVGNWGEAAMTPHTGMSKEDAELMVKYILSLK